MRVKAAGLGFGALMKTLRYGWEQVLHATPIAELVPCVSVLVTLPGGERRPFQVRANECRDGARSKPKVQAIALPEDMVLARTVRLPWANVRDTQRMLQLEVDLNNPFESENCVWGWKPLPELSDRAMRSVLLVMASSQDVTAYQRNMVGEDWPSYECWAWTGNELVPFRSDVQEERHVMARRGWRFNLGMLFLLQVLLVVAALSPVLEKRAAVKAAEAEQLEWRARASAIMQDRNTLESRLSLLEEAVRLREAVVEVEPIFEMITRTVPDDGWLERMEVRDGKILIRGFVGNATALQQALQQQPMLSEVRATMPFARDPVTSSERFSFEMVFQQ